ncbi:MAG: hypothetical protein IPK50_21665 [Fibrobacterota bacterium]|nr:hypothetical protein [Fibrobacterota bacterium]QQS04858.1 MAG: hypothetical protein IPK50_21665 [Fibrobacterota bacterium]
MDTAFQIVYLLLVYGARVTGLTYNEINIVVYYMIIPMIYLAMIDKIVGRHLFKPALAVLILLVIFLTDFAKFSDGLFDLSVKFLLLFNVVGWNYTVASVIICVVVPIQVFAVLFYFSYWPTAKSYFVKRNAAD